MHDSPGLNYYIKIWKKKQVDFLEVGKPEFSAEIFSGIWDFGLGRGPKRARETGSISSIEIESWFSEKNVNVAKMTISAILSPRLLKPWANLRTIDHFRTFVNFWAILISWLYLGYFWANFRKFELYKNISAIFGYFGQFWAIWNSF